MNITAGARTYKLTQMEAKSLPRAKAIKLLNAFDFTVTTFASGKDMVEGIAAQKPADWFVRQMRAYGVYLIWVPGGYIIQNRG